MDLGVKGKVALVCASSHGLGFATAARLAREGASVVICGRDADAVETARGQIAADGGTAIGIAVDLTSVVERIRLVREAQSALGAIDIAVLNTGGPPTGTFASIGLEQVAGGL